MGRKTYHDVSMKRYPIKKYHKNISQKNLKYDWVIIMNFVVE